MKNFTWKKATPFGRAWALVCALLLAACGGVEQQERGDGEVLGLPEVAQNERALGEVRVRIMAANTTSGTLQSYDPGHGTRIFQGTRPDVVAIQEFNYGSNSATDIRTFVNTAFGTGFYYYREGGAQIPNGIISRWPILAAGEWDDPYVTNRDFAWARIDVPGPKDLWVVSVHLLTSSSGSRNSEATSLVSFIKANVPAGDYLAIAGDFNTSSRTEATFSTFSQVVSTAAPYPADRNGNTNTNASRGSPYDHVLVDDDLRAFQTATVIGASSFAAGLVADTRVYSPISEISPALAADSGASGMQHMGVIKDFLIPGDTVPTASVTVTSPNGGESLAGGSATSITWTASGVSNVKVEYTLDGSTWSVLTASTAASSGSYAWTVPNSASTAARVRVSDAANAAVSDTSNAAFTITVSGTGGGTGAVVINEILANEAGSDVAGEFVELVNTGSGAADLSGWTLLVGTTVRHTFAAGTTLAAGKAIVVFGGAAGIPAGTSNAVAASTGGLVLGNSGSSVTVKSGTTTIDSFTYTSALSGTDGVSMNRSPDVTGTSFVLHTAVSTAQRSPGTRANGTAF
jgi:endonuclease/exonuclease/phosphatase family metal-dependent hydrolase